MKGTKASAQEIDDIYEGLKQSSLTDFDVLLSGFAPGANAVNSVGAIARDLKSRSLTKPGFFFWGSCRANIRSSSTLILSSNGSCHGRSRKTVRQ